MTISGKVINGRLIAKYKGNEYPLIYSNARAVEAYLHSGSELYLLALVTEKEMQRYAKQAVEEISDKINQ